MEWRQSNFRIMGEIMACLDNKFALLVLRAQTPNEMWKKLRDRIIGDTLFKLYQLTKQLDNMKYKAGTGM